jgi:RimJ/RimL family protein N-acetyltransferase
MEVSYLFLQTAWGKGYATEAVNALLEACKKAKQENKTLWTQYSKIYVRALVSPRNPRSQRVVEKSGLQHISDFDWAGEPVYVAGKWRERDIIQIWGCMLNEVMTGTM